MKKSCLVPVFICLALVAGLIWLSFHGIGTPAEHRFLIDGWEYSRGNGNSSGPEPGWQWRPLKPAEQPGERSEPNELWLRTLLPPEPAHNPVLFLPAVNQTFAVYADGIIVHQYGQLPAPPEAKTAVLVQHHIIPLLDSAAGSMLYIRVSSSAGIIGMAGAVEYGTMEGIFTYENLMDFLRGGAVMLMLAAALLALLMYGYGRREHIYLSFAGNALGAASTVVASIYAAFWFYPNPAFWSGWLIISTLSWKFFWLQFLLYIVPERYRQPARRLVWLTAVVACAQIIAAFVRPEWGSGIVAGNIAYVAGCVLAFIYFCRRQLSYDRETQFYAGGLAVALAAALVDNLSAVGLLSTPVPIGWIGQLSEVSGLAAILILRYAATQRQLRLYARELEELTATLETKVEERTEKLSIQNACLEQLFTNSPDAIVMLDLQCRVTKANPAFTALFGYTAREAEDRDIGRLLRIPADTPAEEGIAACLDQPQGVPLDLVRRHKDGTPLTVALTTYPFITESGETGVYAIYRDISRRFLAERILKDSERKYRLLAENLDAVVWLMDFDQQPIYVSPSLERLTGYTLTEYLRQPLLREKNRRLQATVDEVRSAYRRGERPAPAVLEEEKRIRDGRLIWIESTVSIAYDENGEAMGILGVSRDITARKRTEKLLSLAYERKRINHFFSDLLDGALPSEQDIYDRARRLRVNLPQSFAVCFCQVEDSRHSAGSEGEDMLLDEVVDRLNRQAGLVAWTFSGGIGVLCRLPLPYGGRQAERQAAEDCLKLLQGDFPGVRFSMGVGDYSASLTDFISRFRHAATAARIGRRHEDSCIRCYEDCGIDEIFDNFAGTREAEAFVRRVLGPLHDYDRDNGTELVETLIHILSRATLKEIAEAMFIHPKTIAARKQRIEQIVKLSLDSFEDRMTLGAALKIDKILQAGNGGRS